MIVAHSSGETGGENLWLISLCRPSMTAEPGKRHGECQRLPDVPCEDNAAGSSRRASERAASSSIAGAAHGPDKAHGNLIREDGREGRKPRTLTVVTDAIGICAIVGSENVRHRAPA
jgi:hypothetical protein